jgi:hypothetical protein
MFGMTNLTNQTLHCMPWPEQVSLPTGRTTPLGRHDSATVIQVAGDPTGRLTRYAQQVLGSFAVGILDITVAAQDPELTPFLQMDESYRLQVTGERCRAVVPLVLGCASRHRDPRSAGSAQSAAPRSAYSG